MLINLKDMLETANTYHFAVGAFNTTEVSLLRSVVEEAEITNTPAIIQMAIGEFNFCGEDYFNYVVKRLEKSKCPFVLHLDHGKSFEDCMKAIRAGFTSVMFDGSELPYEENIRLTKKVVEAAHSVGVSVEGEIGTIGSMSNSDEGGVENITYTKPAEVVNFVESTGVDALAIAIGTAHGIYPKNFRPHLQLKLLAEIAKVSPVPLVLHGGSDNPDEEIKEACKIGIQKVNISSDIKKVFFAKIQSVLNETGEFMPPKVFNQAIEETKKTVNEKMKLFGSIGKASYYR